MIIDFTSPAGLSHYYKKKGHTFGQCYVDPTSTLMYINVPKNASSWTKDKLVNTLGWSRTNYLESANLYNTHSLIVLRDPIERWFSGIGEYMKLYHPSATIGDVTPLMLDMIFDRVAFDDHTDCQIYFISNININNATFFLADQNFKTNFSEFFKERGIDNKFNISNNTNINNESNFREMWTNYFRELCLNNSKYYNKLLSYFQMDFELMKRVEIYNQTQRNN